jgi:diguanylate cyclase (GGDEF)-like protein/PAS domain S-box-containing protein
MMHLSGRESVGGHRLSLQCDDPNEAFASHDKKSKTKTNHLGPGLSNFFLEIPDKDSRASVRVRSREIGGSGRLALRRRYGNLARVAGCFVTSLAATYFVGLEIQINVIWVANGLLLSYLLLAPRWRWRAYLLAGFAAQVCGNVLVGHQGWQTNVVLAILNVGEALLAALFLRGRVTQLPRLTERYYLLRFLGLAVIAAPAIVAVLFAGIAHLWQNYEFWPAFRDWVTTDGLGTTVVTPAFVAIFRMRLKKETIASWTNLIYPAAMVILDPLLLKQSVVPPMAVIFPLLILIQLRFGLGWASIAVLFVAGMGNFHLFHNGVSPRTAGPLSYLGSGIQLQLFLASAMFILYAISVVMANLRSTERKLRETVYLHELVTENSRDVIIIADFLGNRSYVSAAGTSVGGWTKEDLLNMHSLDIVHPDDRPKAAERVEQLRTGQGEAMLECRVRKTDGNYVWVEASLRAIRDPMNGIPTGILNIVRDVNERKLAEESRAFHQSLLGAIHEGSLDGILVVDDQGKAVSYNRRFAEVWQIDAPDVPRSLLKPVVEVFDERLLSRCIDKTRDPAAFLTRVQELYIDRHADDQCQVDLKDGRTLERYTTALRTDDGRYLGRVWFFRDVTERIQAEDKLKAAYEEVEKLAVIDNLTGIANRRRFEEYLDAEWRRAIRERKPLSMVLVDVDLFKLFNDGYGHVRGDECLKQIAETAIEVVTRAGDLVARFGGEEFAIVLPNTDEEGALQIATELRGAVANRRTSHEASPYGVVTISAGCATTTPRLGLAPSQLVDWADRAMYEAKRRGRNRVCTSSDLEAEIGGLPSTPAVGMKMGS